MNKLHYGRFIPVEFGKRFGSLVALDYGGQDGRKHLWWVVCDCGLIYRLRKDRLLNGITKSCGQCNWEKKNPKEYAAWHNMQQRCTNKASPNYADYGGRGITIDPSWNSFAIFLADMGLKPSPDLTLDRKDNELGYNKDNCRWVNWEVQANNRRNTLKWNLLTQQERNNYE